MKLHDYLGSSFCLIVGLYVFVGSFGLGLGTFQEPGPGFIFLFAGSLLTIFSLNELRKTFLKKGGDRKTLWSDVKWTKILLVLIGISAFLYFFERLGFIFSIFLLMLFLYKVVEPTRWWIALFSSFLTTLAAYIIFELWLKIPFPQGLIDALNL
jgi:hypothetical protein